MNILFIMILLAVCVVAFSLVILFKTKQGTFKMSNKIKYVGDPFWNFTIKTSVVSKAKSSCIWDMNNPTWTIITYRKEDEND